MHSPQSLAKTVIALTFTMAIASGICYGQTESVIYSFQSVPDVSDPAYGLFSDQQGNLYGSSSYGGSGLEGGVFQLTRSKPGVWRERVTHSFVFDGADGIQPESEPVVDKSGNIYIATSLGGTGLACSGGCGVVAEFQKSAGGGWTETILHNFKGGSDGAYPEQIMLDPAGNVFGVTETGGLNASGVFYELVDSGDGRWTEKVLYDFGTGTDAPAGGLVMDAQGNLYGVSSNGAYHYGSVFQLSPEAGGAWTEQTFYSFTDEGNVGYGSRPNAHLALAADGSLYGTTQAGGLPNVACGDYNCGFVFRLARNSDGTWSYEKIHEFAAGTTDGGIPRDGVILDRTGNVYGTTWIGGGKGSICTAGSTQLFCGVVFELSPRPDGTFAEKLLHRFSGSQDGAAPFARPVLDGDHNLYGTTTSGGSGLCGSVGCGVVWKIAR